MNNPPRKEFEILIIGGGPAGLSTALHLAKIAPTLAGKTLVIEKESYPRDKLCAGGLTVDAEIILNELDLNINEIPFRPAKCTSLLFEGKGLTLQPKGKPTLKVIRRDEFDQWLAINTRKRGISVRENTYVRNIRFVPNGVIVESDSESFHARMIVGADGSNGITRSILFPGNKLRTARLLEMVKPEAEKSAGDTDRSIFDFEPIIKSIGGYVWDFPTKINGEAYRCYGIFDNNLWRRESKPALKSVLFDQIEKEDIHPDEGAIQGHPLRLFNPSMPFSKPGVLMVGDAAGSDPLFGEGISLAMGYGFLAAKAIREAYKKNNFEFKTYRRDILWSSLGQTLILRKIIAKILYSIRWRSFHRIFWHGFRPVIKVAGWLFVLNWSKRLY